ncbi:MAG: hypothetical protein ACHREM_02195 [Polyangiales bacterium]
MPARVYVHLGDSKHRPMLTTSVYELSELRARAKDARNEHWPIRFQVGTEIVSQKEAERHLSLPRR